MRVYVAYIPLWISIIVVLLVNTDTIRIMRKSLHSQISSVTNLNGAENNGKPKFKIPSKATLEFIRLIAIAVAFLIIHIPGSYLRVIEMSTNNKGSTSGVVNVFFAISLPIPGIINCFIWIISNKTVISDWQDNCNYIIRRYPTLLRIANSLCVSSYSGHIVPNGPGSSSSNKNIVVFLHKNSNNNILNNSAINLKNT